MSDGLDFSVEGMEAEVRASAPPAPTGWAARRMMGVGCSELAIVGCLVGDLDASLMTKSVQEQLGPFKRGGAAVGHSKWAARKAGLARFPKDREDDYLEAEILDRLIAVLPGMPAPMSWLLPETIHHVERVPGEWIPLVDRVEPKLLCSPDAWGRDMLKRLVALDCKRTLRSGPTEGQLIKWKWQVTGQCAVMGASWGAAVAAEGILGDEYTPVRIVPYVTEPTTDEIATVRRWARVGMEMVEAAREDGRKAGV